MFFRFMEIFKKILFLFFIFIPFFVFGQPLLLERLELNLPPKTELVERKQEGSFEAPTLTVYKFKSQLPKDAIAKFYRYFLKNEGFVELEEAAIAADYNQNQTPYYLFSRNNELIVLNILSYGEEVEEEDLDTPPQLIYYLTIHHIFY
ncbi:MAG: hypothetical protein NC918_06010 [Candidatus Omnitrophica bacterium]|nr:hypothetical protein [Candidatus Omnitrophota bacterium]